MTVEEARAALWFAATRIHERTPAHRDHMIQRMNALEDAVRAECAEREQGLREQIAFLETALDAHQDRLSQMYRDARNALDAEKPER